MRVSRMSRDYSAFIARYEGGETPLSIARSIGIHHVTVYRGLRAMGVRMRGIGEARRGHPTKARGRPNLERRRFDHEKAGELYKAGACLREVAELLEVSEEPIRRALILLAIPRRPRGGGPHRCKSHHHHR